MALSVSLLIGFGIIVAIQIIYYFSFLYAFSKIKGKPVTKKNIALSVIICAKNEAENLREKLPLILCQDYPNFEIVLVNDSSSDNTLEVMTDFESENNNIRVVDVKSNEAFWGNKKYALTLGIKASKHDFLVFTDADCKPLSKYWLSNMSTAFSNDKAIVLGYGGYLSKRFSFLNKLIRFETVMTALQYFSYAWLGQPYMGVGRNLAYRKELFFNNKGFSEHMGLMSGDDDLFVNAVATKQNVSVVLDENSFTASQAKTTFKDWLLQKRRHISTSNHYKTKHKLLLGLFYVTQLLFWVMAPLGFFFKDVAIIWLVLFVLRLLVQWAAFGYAAIICKEKNLIVLTPLLDLFLVSIQLFIFSVNLISKPGHWK